MQAINIEINISVYTVKDAQKRIKTLYNLHL